MAGDAKPSFGSIVMLGVSSGSLTALSKRFSVGVPKRTRDAIDATDHGSPDGYAEFIADGVTDGGTLNLVMNYIAGDADDDLCNTVFDAGNGFVSWTVNAASGTATLGPVACVFTEYGPDEMAVKGKQTATLVCKISGKAAQAATT